MSYYQGGRPCASPFVKQQRQRARSLPVAYGSQEMAGLGFSLKPPKWLRKAQPGKILKKIAVPAALIGGALLIPGVAPAALAVAKGGGRLAVSGVKGIGKIVTGAFKPKPPSSVIKSVLGKVIPTSGTTQDMVPFSPTPSFAVSQPVEQYAPSAAPGFAQGSIPSSADFIGPQEPTAAGMSPDAAARTAGQAIGPAALVVGVIALFAVANAVKRR